MAATEVGTRAAHELDELYRLYAPNVYRFAFAMLGNRPDAEDVTQTTFVNALRALERGERPRRPENWLVTIAHNLVRQRWRQEQARPAQVALAQDLPDRENGDETPSITEMVEALARIPPQQREALVLREFEGRSYAEIAEILQVTQSSLETLLFRARRSLAEEMESIVTCERAEQALSAHLDGRLPRNERRRLTRHLRECPDCARFELVQRRQRRALRSLAVIPLPLSLTFFKGTNTAAAATLPALGTAAATTAGGTALGGGAAAAGGAALGAGLAAKAAAVVAAASIAGGVAVGVEQVRDEGPPARPAPAATKVKTTASVSAPRAAAKGRASGAAKTARANGAAKTARARANGKTTVTPTGTAKAKAAAPANGTREKPAAATDHGRSHVTGGAQARGTQPKPPRAKTQPDKAKPSHTASSPARTSPQASSRPERRPAAAKPARDPSQSHVKAAGPTKSSSASGGGRDRDSSP